MYTRTTIPGTRTASRTPSIAAPETPACIAHAVGPAAEASDGVAKATDASTAPSGASATSDAPPASVTPTVPAASTGESTLSSRASTTVKTGRCRFEEKKKWLEEDLFELFGWSDLPFDLKNAIIVDLAGHREELLGLYSTTDPQVYERRKRVAYWVNCYREGICSLETALQALR